MKAHLSAFMDYVTSYQPRVLQSPVVKEYSQKHIIMNSAPNGYTKTFPLYFGDPTYVDLKEGVQ